MVRMRVKIIAFEGEPIKVSNQYLFYKQFKFGECKQNVKHLSLGQFFFAQISPNDDPCIGELQLLYEDKLNHECLASIRLYFLPEQSPDGRQPRHGEHEVLAASEKVIIRLHDLVTWITDEVVWLTGLEVPCDACPLLQPFSSFTKTPINLSDKSNAVNIRQGASSMSTKFSRGLDFSDIEAEKSKF
ncbi:AT-rich interactive domain-containing protein 5B-like protein, partial [Dinothrombium tinctorium]